MAPERVCQLGRRAEGASVSQRVSMSELMQWKHFSGAIASYGDIYLDHAHSHITYAFQTLLLKPKTWHETFSHKMHKRVDLIDGLNLV